MEKRRIGTRFLDREVCDIFSDIIYMHCGYAQAVCLGDGRRYGQTVGRQDPGENARLQFDVRIRCERKSCAKK